MNLSVIVCSHNPRPDYLRRVLDALKSQTLPREQWELLLIDNVSEEPLSAVWDLAWHPHARHILETKLGKTQALLSGIREAEGRILVVVDDDNVLASDYLMCSLIKMDEHPDVVVWSGTNIAEFEKTPATWKAAFLPYLAINQENEDRVSTEIESAPLPIGAGMIFRREVGQAYLEWMTSVTPRRKVALDRRGGGLCAGEEDTELGIVAIESGFACGRTPSLRLTHLMPRKRITTQYLFRIVRDISYSHQLIYRWHGLKRGQLSWRDFIRRFNRSIVLAAFGAVSGNADRFGRGMEGISSLCGAWLALRSKRT